MRTTRSEESTSQHNAPVAVAGLQGVDRLAARANGSLARPTVTAEQYAYDAEGRRVRRVGADGTRLYLAGGAWEERPGDNGVGPASWVVRVIYTLQGRAVAQRENRLGGVYTGAGRVHLHGDCLGSVGAATDAAGQVLSRQDFTPWGEARSGGVGQTAPDFTGQRRDGTGPPFYDARYDDPQLVRFVSPDSIAPEREAPRTRNRYGYVLNNPLECTDPTGYCTSTPQTDAHFQENAECAKYIGWLPGWGLIVGGTDGRGIDPDSGLFAITLIKNIDNWLPSQLDAVRQGVLRMSNVLGWGTDGRLFREKVLQGRTLDVDKEADNKPGDCPQGAFACAGENSMIFSSVGLQGANEDQWAFNQRMVIHELAHVWDFRLGGGGPSPILTAGHGRAAGIPPDVEAFAESVANVVMAGSKAGPRDIAFYGSSAERYIYCVATTQNRQEGRCG